MWFFAWRCGLPTELRRRYDAPILLPADLDLLSQTSPIPAADPEASLYLHGPSRQPDSITIVWRADIDPEKHKDENIRRLVPPRSFEAIELPLWAVRCWLGRDQKTSADIADVAAAAPEEEERARPGGGARRIFRWKGNDEHSQWIYPAALRPGDTVIAPARYGGVDRFGWNPDCEEAATLDERRPSLSPGAVSRSGWHPVCSTDQ